MWERFKRKGPETPPEIADESSPGSDSTEIDRRSFLRGAGALAAGAALPVLPDSSAEAASKEEKLNKDARKLMEQTKDAHSVYWLNIFHDGRVVPVGQLNTEGYRRIEENRVDKVLESLGYADALTFADAYNAKFAYRSQNDKDLLIRDASFVAEMRASRKDIRMKNDQFINFRKALMIWITADKLAGDHSKNFSLGGKTFNTPEVQRVLPGLKGEHLARLLLDHDLVDPLETMVALAKRNIKIPDVTRPTVPAFASFVRAVEAMPEDVLSHMSTLYFSTGSYGTPGERFIYDQFIASPMGKQYFGVLNRLKNVRLEQNNFMGTDVTKDAFSTAIEKLPQDSEDYQTLNKFLPYEGN